MVERRTPLQAEEEEEGRGPGYRIFMEPTPPAPPPPPRPTPPAPPAPPKPPRPELPKLTVPEEMLENLRRLSDATLRDILSDPVKALTLLNGWDPTACQDVILVYSDTIAPSATSTYTGTMPAGYVNFVLGVEWVVEVPYVLSLSMKRDTYIFHSESALVDSRRQFPYWLPCTNAWTMSLTNSDAVFTTRVHGAVQGFYLKAEVWNTLRPLIHEYGRALSVGGR